MLASLSLPASVSVLNGWNLLGASNNIDLEKTFSKYPDINKVWAYNSFIKNWEAFAIEQKDKDIIEDKGFNALEKIETNKGYWVYNSGATTLIEIEECGATQDTNQSHITVDENGALIIDGESSFGAVDLTTLSETEAKSLLYIREEEKLARDVYLNLYEKWGQNIFKNIANAEQTHTDAVKALLNRYNLEDPVTEIEDKDLGNFKNEELQKIYNGLIEKGHISVTDAIEVGITIEDLDIHDIEKDMSLTDNEDILTIYASLVKGSENHMRAFINNYDSVYTPVYISQDRFDGILASENSGHSDESAETTNTNEQSQGNQNQHGK